MQSREIARADWQSFFYQVSKVLQGKQISIEVDSLQLGAQIEAERLSLNGLTYDPRDDAFIVGTEDLEHVIRSPLQIFVTEGDAGMGSIEVRAADGSAQIVNLVEPLALPPAD